MFNFGHNPEHDWVHPAKVAAPAAAGGPCHSVPRWSCSL